MKKKVWNILETLTPVYLLLFVLCIASFKQKTSRANDATVIRISGTVFLFPLVEKWAAEYKKDHPDVSFVIQPGLSNTDITVAGAPVKTIDPNKGIWKITARYALVPIVSDKYPALNDLLQKGISKKDVYQIYFNGQSKLDAFQFTHQVVPIHVYTRNACASATFTDHFGKQIADLNNLNTTIKDDKALLQTVINDSLGIAYNNLGFVYDLTTRKQKAGIRIVPYDANGNGKIDVEEDTYQNLDVLIKRLEYSDNELPPIGTVALVYKEENTAAKSFTEWVATKGQQYNHQMGFLLSNKVHYKE